MSVTKDLNLGTVVSVAMFLLMQSGALVWWASSIQAAVDQVELQVSQNLRASNAVNARQWDRLGDLESTVQNILSQEQGLLISVDALQDNLTELRTDIRQNNVLLRQLLQSGNVND